MKSMQRSASILAVGLLASALATPLAAQEAGGSVVQVISANPFGLLLDLFNAEYERQITESSTAGFGGSFMSDSGDDYINADVFWRFYPSARPAEGWAFGIKAGITNVPDSGTFFGFGFDTNWSWRMGKKKNFYLGIGFGLKRLYGTDDEEFDLKYIPTFRIVNVGVVF